MDINDIDTDGLAVWPPANSRRGTPMGRTGPLPMPELMIGTGAMNRFEYSVAVICCHGQVGDRAAVKRLGWLPEQPISLTVAGRTAVAFEHSDGGFRVDHDGHLRLPAVIRHRCGIEPGDRLLIAASVPGRLLLIYPLVVIDQALSTLHEQATSTVR